MKKFLNVATIVALGVLLFVIALLAHGENVFAWEWHHASLISQILSGLCFVGAVAYPLFAYDLTISKNENLNNLLLVLIWGALLALGFLFAGYWSTEFNNPYL